jgi:uncharacterized protein (TIGR03437 family)
LSWLTHLDAVHCYYSVVSFSRIHGNITRKLNNRAAFLLFILTLPLMCQPSTTISIASSANPAILGQRVTLSASINPVQATGEVTFYDESLILGIAPVANGSATLSTILLSPGQRSLKARFESHSGFAASASQAIAVTVNSSPSSALGKPASYPTASTINQHIAVADFNGDGHLDIVTNNFTVLMGNGDGTFQPPVYYTAQINADAVATGDFNGDGHPDFVSNGNGGLGIWLNKGDGTFLPPVFYQVGAAPLSIAVADFNNDGVADVAVASRQGNFPGIAVLIGVGDGTFKSAVNYLAPQRQQALAVADFNGDGNADIVSVDSDDIEQNVTILLGAGDGTFRTGATYSTAVPYAVAVGDFNKDGRPDFVVGFEFSNLSVFLGNGDGTFAQEPTPLQTLEVSPFDFGVSIGDFDGDGNPDIAYAGSGGSEISIFIGNGDGTFRGAVNFPAGSSPQALVAAEFNGDGRTDLAVTNGSSVQILLGATGNFPTVTTTSLPSAMDGVPYSATLEASGGTMPYTWSVSAGSTPVPLTSGGELMGTPPVTAHPGLDNFSVVVSGANGPGFRSSQNFSVEVAAAFNVSFVADLVGEVGAPYSGFLQASGGTPPYQNWKVTAGSLPPGVSLDSSSGQFGGTPTAAGTFSFTVTVNDSSGLTSLPANLSIEVVPALIIVTTSLPNGFVGVPYYTILSATGGFPPYQNWAVTSGALPPGLTINSMSGAISGTPTTTAGSPFSFTISVGSQGKDVTSKVFTIAISTVAPNQMTLTSSANPSKLGSPVTLIANLSLASASGTVAFYDGAAFLGTALASSGQAKLTVNLPTAGTHFLLARFLSPPASATLSQVVAASATASLLAPVSYPSMDAVGLQSPVVVADFNRDGKADIATLTSVLLGNGDGTFQAPLTHYLDPGASLMVVADFNEDGIPDIIIDGQGNLRVLLGNGDGTFQTGQSYGSNQLPGSFGALTAADFNGDGHVDLLVTLSSSLNPPALLYLGVGDGTFRSALNVTGITSAIGITSGDFNGDGLPDAAYADKTSIYILLSHGDGTFAAPVAYPLLPGSLGLSVTTLVPADVNGDGLLDLLAMNGFGVTVLLGRGDGTFRAPVHYIVGTDSSINGLAVGDWNGDGFLDAAVGRYQTGVTILLGNGDGSFRLGASPSFGGGTRLELMALGDFNGDGHPDLAISTGNSSVNVLLGSSIAGADQLSVSPSAINAVLTSGGSTSTQAVTLSYQTTSQTAPSFSLLTYTGDFLWLSVSPQSGPMTLASQSGSLYTYTATVNINLNPGFSGAGSSQQTLLAFNVNGAPVWLPVSMTAGTVPQVTGVVNAAASAAAAPSVVSPGGYVTIYGRQLATPAVNASAASVPLPATLDGAQVTIGGVPVPLLYASSGQINGFVPQEIGPSNSYPLVVIPGVGSPATIMVMVQELQPGIYTVDQSGSGAGIVTNALTGQLISAANPAHASDYLSIYCTGLGPLVGPSGQLEPTDGAAAPTTMAFQTIAKVTATIGGVDAPVLFSGLTPGFAGLYQVNVQVPTGVSASDAAALLIKAADSQTGAEAQSNPVTIAVQ